PTSSHMFTYTTLFRSIVASHTVGLSNTGGLVSQDYNLFFGNGSDLLGTVSGGAHSASGAPRFRAPAQDDYHLGPDSAAVDIGAKDRKSTRLNSSHVKI